MAGQYNRKDHLYNRAKTEGYRSRAAFKLMEIDDKYKLIRPRCSVLDLGAWPGGWLQVAAARAGAEARLVGIDLTQIEDFGAPNIKAFTGDVRDEGVIAAALDFSGGRFDLLLSDMSPKLTGIREVDNSAAVACAELALQVASKALKDGANLVIKVFKSSESDQLIRRYRACFSKLVRAELKSTRQTSNEYYIVGRHFKTSAQASA